MSGSKLSGSGSRRAPRHTWTTNQKRCLLLLCTNFYPSPDDIGKVAAAFNHVFGSEINARDFPHGLPCKSLIAQFREHKQSDNASWLKVTRPESWETELKLREELTAKITRSLNARDGKGSRSGQDGSALPQTPRANSRKRTRTIAEHHVAVSSDTSTAFQARPSETASAQNAMVLIPRIEAFTLREYTMIEDKEEELAPSTPVKRIKTGLVSPPSTTRVIRNSGPALEVSWKIHAEIEKGYSPPSEQEAHPPLGGLFWRFWDPEHSQGQNSAQGFVAKRYVRSNAVPVRAYVPPAKHLDPTDLWNHLNMEKESTPFVSVSDSLPWILHKLSTELRSGKWQHAKLSAIDSKRLSPATVFHAAGFYRQLKKIRSFTQMAQRGVSNHEYLIWRDIPESAMIKTLTVGEIVAATAQSRDLAKLLRLEVLMASGGYQTAIRPRLQQGNVEVTVHTAASIAQSGQLLGIEHDSAFEHHRHFVNDLVSSYKMVVAYHTPEDWRTIAAHYSHAFCRASTTPISAKDQAVLKLAFLEGVRLGASHDFKLARIDPKALQLLQRKARLIGLEEPGRIVAGEADAVKLHVGLEQSRQWKVFECRPSRMLLMDEGDVDDDDGGSTFEMDEDGVVV